MEESFVTTYWPADILNPGNEFRSVKIIVKNNEAISDDTDMLKEDLDQRWKEVNEQTEKLKNDKFFASDPSRQKALSGRVKLNDKHVKSVYGIALPLPNELNDSQTHDWETSEGFIAGAMGKLDDKIFGGMGEQAMKAVAKISSSYGYRKPLIDPGYFQDYKGTHPREFTFSWDLIPANKGEVDSIMSILYNLKKYTLPTSVVSGVALLSPFMFDIIIGNERIKNLMNMNNVICKSMSIDYNAAGSPQFLPDGMPKYIKLEMLFAERSLVTAEFY